MNAMNLAVNQLASVLGAGGASTLVLGAVTCLVFALGALIGVAAYKESGRCEGRERTGAPTRAAAPLTARRRAS
jgi:hypothetical protein